MYTLFNQKVPVIAFTSNSLEDFVSILASQGLNDRNVDGKELGEPRLDAVSARSDGCKRKNRCQCRWLLIAMVISSLPWVAALS